MSLVSLITQYNYYIASEVGQIYIDTTEGHFRRRVTVLFLTSIWKDTVVFHKIKIKVKISLLFFIFDESVDEFLETFQKNVKIILEPLSLRI